LAAWPVQKLGSKHGQCARINNAERPVKVTQRGRCFIGRGRGESSQNRTLEKPGIKVMKKRIVFDQKITEISKL
jgi:hypothetical protein